MTSRAVIDYTMEDDSLGVRDALYSAIQDRVMAHIEAKKAEIAANFITPHQEETDVEVDEDLENEMEYYANVPEGVEVFVPKQSITEAKDKKPKEEHPWRMDKDREGTGYHEINSVRPKTALVNGVPKNLGLEHDGVHSHAFDNQHEAEKAAFDLASLGHMCTHHCPQGYAKAVIQPHHPMTIGY